MSRIDIAELNDFLHGLRTSNAEAKGMIRKIKEAAMDYTQDNSLKGAAVSTSKSYFSSTYTSITQSILEALDESEERLAQYIREFGSQVDSSPSCKVDAQVLQEVMDKVSQLQRKEETLQEQLTAPNTRPDMQEVYAVKTKSAHTQLLKAIEKEQILEKYIAFEQSHGQFFSALDELIRATGQAVQELLDKVTFNDQTGTYSIPQSTTASLQRMKKALDTARTENDKDPYPESFEDYTLLAYTYVNDRGETVTMWLLEKDGKRANNKELQAFLEEHGNDLNPVLYTELSGEELERKVNDAWKDGVNYLNGQKVSGPSAGILKSSAYVASMKDAMDDAGLTEMSLSLGFGIAAARNKHVIEEKTNINKTKNAVPEEELNDFATDIFLPDEYYTNYRLPSRVEPGTKSLNKFDELGNLKQTKFYDQYGREKGWIDYTNHGRPQSHSAPHWHEYIYNAEFPLGKKTDHRFDTNPPFKR
ncbi:T7SS effector LXG polymorphic toxin [Listeria seeligeri]|uniref:T7SS effector LXG polymorphic toxin n=1 Tax=Listeria seeligeri TaxID=1640 RepID=UPI001888BA6E|nr:T7SS effector LXG polymorphic toxin [Listeria seeligeri]MBF2663706.1 hypothetical protein [Listeria seeligeri]